MNRDSILDSYSEDENLSNFNLIHIYPGNLCGKYGMQNSRFFKVVGFNTENYKKRYLGDHDDLRRWNLGPLRLDGVQVFKDRSVILIGRFSTVPELSNDTQTLYLI